MEDRSWKLRHPGRRFFAGSALGTDTHLLDASGSLRQQAIIACWRRLQTARKTEVIHESFLALCLSIPCSQRQLSRQEGAPDTQITPVDPRTNIEGYPSSRPFEASSPSLKQLAGAETKLWQARTSGKTSLIKKFMSEEVTIASYTSAKDRQQWIAAIETGTCQWKSYKLKDFVLKDSSYYGGLDQLSRRTGCCLRVAGPYPGP